MQTFFGVFLAQCFPCKTFM